MKTLFIVIVLIVLTIIGGTIALSMMDVTVTQETVRKEIVIETPTETKTDAPKLLPVQ